MTTDVGKWQGRRAVRFDEFVAKEGIVVTPVEHFGEFAVAVVLPPDWEPFSNPPVDSMLGTRAWTWPSDPVITKFGANAVLSMSRVEAPLDPSEVFAMLCEWQLHMVQGSHERYRGLTAASDVTGVVGTLIMEVPTEFGLIGSESLTYVIPAGPQTLIAQLTISALTDSPIDRNGIRLILARDEVQPTSPVGGAPVSYLVSPPITASEGEF